MLELSVSQGPEISLAQGKLGLLVNRALFNRRRRTHVVLVTDNMTDFYSLNSLQQGTQGQFNEAYFCFQFVFCESLRMKNNNYTPITNTSV